MNGFRGGGRGRGGFQGGRGGGGFGGGRGGGQRPPRRVEDKDQFKKLFIGGLSFETTSESLRKYFETFGEITDCVVMMDKNTNKPKGFGFITYVDPASVDEVQDKRPHKLDGRDVDTKRAMPKEDAGKPECKEPTKKIFLGGLKDDTTEDDVRAICQEFGPLEKVDVIKDKETGKGRGFGFVTFCDTDKVDKIYLKGCVDICGRTVEIKKAVEKAKLQAAAGGDSGGGMYGAPQQQAYSSYGQGGGGGGGYAPQQSYGGYPAQQSYGAQPSYGGVGAGAYGMGTGYEGGYSAGPMRGGYQQPRQSPYAPPAAAAPYGAGSYGSSYTAGGYGGAAGGGYGARRY